MANMNDLVEEDTIDDDDYILLRRVDTDYKIKKSNLIASLRPVGSTYRTTDAAFTPTAPNFTGTWEVVDSECLILAADPSSTTTGTPTGSNIVSVPVLAHSHVASVVMNSGHTHDVPAGTIYYDNIINTGTDTEAAHSATPAAITSTAAGAHTHTATVGQTGTPSATVNVRGLRFGLIVWRRTA
jgi:hypothetical protein